MAAASSRVGLPRLAASSHDPRADAAEEEAELLRQIDEDQRRVAETRRRLESMRKRGSGL